VFAGVSLTIGGDSIGTLPSKQGFVVTSHGNETVVSERTWLFCLFYPAATLSLSPLLIVPFFATEVSFSNRRARYFAIGLACLWYLLWFWSILSAAIDSWIDYVNM
jgi:hypothetical protein